MKMFKLIVVCAFAAIVGSRHGGLTGALAGLGVSLAWSYVQGFYEAWKTASRSLGASASRTAARSCVSRSRSTYRPTGTALVSATQCPRGVKVQLLGKSGVAVYGQWNGADDFWVAWAPLPKRRPN